MATYEPYYAVNSQVYNIASEGELANILSHYNSDFVFNVIKDNIGQRMNKYGNTIQMVNIVGAFEQQFRLLKSTYHSESPKIEEIRLSTYKEIIDILCKEYQLIFNDTGDIDYYTAAFCLYDFLVCNFDTYVVSFFSIFIHNESNTLFDALNMSTLKKNKDTSTVYSKKLYEDPKFAIVTSNLGSVLYSISGYYISFENILRTVLTVDMATYMSTIIQPQIDFYRNIYCAYILNEDTFPISLTNIRLDMQRRYSIQNNQIMGGTENV